MEKIKLKIDYSRCKECGICLDECPQHQNKKGHKHVDHEYDLCDRCLHCYAVCPQNAIIVQDGPIAQPKLNIDSDKLLNHLMYRRSYRRFLNKPLTNESIEKLIESTRYIPSGGNDHRIEITVLNSNEKRDELLSAIIEYYKRIKKLLKNPVLQIIAKQIGEKKVKETLKDPFYFKKILNIIEDIENKDDPVFYHAPAIFIFHTNRIMPTAKEDCILAAYNVVLMSETLGLGSCFVSLSQQAIANDKKCKKILSIPASHFVDAVVTIGYPKRYYKRPAIRNTKNVRFI
jgi:nitroreductase/NAD-dependent dihydropyrimidine dehydrogenase PreA subunit